MASVNKVIILGHLGQDPETRHSASGTAFCNISVATSEQWKDKTTGEKKEATEWHRITFADKLAEIAGQYLKKGTQVYIEGSLRTRKWTDNSGVERYTTEIRADKMQMLGGKDKDSVQQSAPSTTREPAPKANAAPAAGGADDFDDGIPF